MRATRAAPVAELGSFGALVHAAGGLPTMDAWRRIWDVHLRGSALLLDAFGHMLERLDALNDLRVTDPLNGCACRRLATRRPVSSADQGGDAPELALGPGDIVLQRGTNHLWHAVGTKSLRMPTVMVAVQA